MSTSNNGGRETREKFGSQAKRALQYLRDNKGKALFFRDMHREIQKFVKEPKKSIDLICLYESLGLLTRIDPDAYVYTGFIGIAQRLQEYEHINNSQPPPQTNARKPQFRKLDNITFEEVQYQDKTISIRPHLLAGLFFNELFFGLIYANGRFTTKNQIEALVEEFSATHKEVSTRSFLPDMINILSMLGFVEKNEATEVVSYGGPDLRVFDQKTFKKSPDRASFLLHKEEQFFAASRELGSSTTLLHKNSQGPKTSTPQEPPSMVVSNKNNNEVDEFQQLAEPGGSEYRNNNNGIAQMELEKNFKLPVPMHASYFPEPSFCMLKSKNWEYPINKLHTIIGRSNQAKSWEVDLDLPFKSVSRQHAAILFNFEAKKWEIRCLSRKNAIKVDGDRYTFRDKRIWLGERSLVQVGPQVFVFCLPEREDTV